MDQITRTLAQYVAQLNIAAISDNTLLQTKIRVIDTIACAMGGYDSEPAHIARRLSEGYQSNCSAGLFGTRQETTIEMAAFTNAVMTRYLDYNDTYISKGAGHPSDMIPACIAVAEAYGCNGQSTLLAIIAAYEIFTALADAVGLRDRGWDQGLYVAIGSTVGVAKLLNLNEIQIGNAIAIASTCNIASRQTRSGELSMWKGCATAHSARAGVFAAMLAKEGMTGPTAAFEGRHGLWDQVTGHFSLNALGDANTPFGIVRTNLKFFPSEYHSQAPLWMALQFRTELSLNEIAGIRMQTYHTAYSEIGSEIEKWHPRTRETADHSLPYLFALALRDGFIDKHSFKIENINDTNIHALMQKITISENPQCTSAYPEKMVTLVDIQLQNGKTYSKTAEYPRGYALNPMSNLEVETKFNNLTREHMSIPQRQLLLKHLWQFDQLENIRQATELIKI